MFWISFLASGTETYHYDVNFTFGWQVPLKVPHSCHKGNPDLCLFTSLVLEENMFIFFFTHIHFKGEEIVGLRLSHQEKQSYM